MLIARNDRKENPSKLKIISSWPGPSSLTDFSSLFGLLQFFQTVYPKTLQNLYTIDRPNKKGSSVHSQDENGDIEFEKLKTVVNRAPILIFANWKKSIRGHFDASQTAVGGTLTQRDENW